MKQDCLLLLIKLLFALSLFSTIDLTNLLVSKELSIKSILTTLKFKEK